MSINGVDNQVVFLIKSCRLTRWHKVGRLCRAGWCGKVLLAVCIALIAASDLTYTTSLPSLQAQPAEDPRWTQFTHQQDRLISNNVRVLVSVDDSLWFGTDAGISRYTGEWRSFPAANLEHNAVTGLGGVRAGQLLGMHAPPGQTTALTADARGRVWAGTSLGALAVWEGDAFRLEVSDGAYIHALATTAAGMWVGTDAGLYLWADDGLSRVPALGQSRVFALAVDETTLWVGSSTGLWRLRDERWTQIATNERWLAEGVYSLWIDPQRTLWVGTQFGLAWRYHSSSRWQFIATVDEQGIPAPVQSMHSDHTGAIWLGTDGAGVLSVADDDNRPEYSDQSRAAGLNIRFVRGVTVDQDGSIWLATPAGVFRYQTYMWANEVVGADGPDDRDYINDLLVDRQGRLWIATGGAGIRRKPAAGSGETLFGAAAGVPGVVYALAEDDVGGIWAGTHSGLIYYAADTSVSHTSVRQTPRWMQPLPQQYLPDGEVISLLYAEDVLWIGTGRGLAGYHLGSASLFIVPELAGKRIEALARDGTGALWVGADPGVHVFDADGDYTLHRQELGARRGLPGGPVTGNGLAADPHNPVGMWVNLRDEGLVYWDGASWQRDPMGEHVAGSLVWDVSSDTQDGSLWIGSESGLTRFDGTTWALLTAHDGLQTASVQAVARAAQGGYWVGGRNGLTHYRPDGTLPWIRVAGLGGAAESIDDSPENDNNETNNNGSANSGDSTGGGGTGGVELQVTAGEQTYLNIAVGDLQTPQHRLKASYRMGHQSAEGEMVWEAWQSTPNGVVPFLFDNAGDYRLEFQARDLSFNYSPAIGFDLQVVPPFTYVTVPVLGEIPLGIFRTLAVLGLLVVAGTLYITVELARHRRQSLDALKRKFNPYISGEPVRRDDMFFGRRALLQRIVDTLHHNSIMIHGERRIGKTTLLYQLVAVLRDVDDPDYWFIPAYIDLEGTEQAGFFHYLIEEIVHAVESTLEIDIATTAGVDALGFHGLEDADYTDREFNRDLRLVVLAMQVHGEQFEGGKQARLILLLDEMDVVSGYDQLVQQQLRRIFMREFAATVGAVVAGIRISKAWDRVESPWFNLFNEIALEPFTREQGRELLTEPVKGFYTYRVDAIEFILDRADGRPFKIQQYGLEAVNQMLLANRRTILLQDAQQAHERLCAVEAAQEAIHAPPKLSRKETY
ncbi:MAG: two-component regulator propeller domain-containing protein [Litorilinea sp.]